jgi:PAS domain S-box-containing protein
MEGGEQIDKPLRDLIEIIHFTETVSAKVHGVLDEAEICRIIREEFAETSLAPGKLKTGEKALGIRLKEYKIDLNKSSIYSRVVREGKTVQVSVSETIGELFPRPLNYLISKIMDYEKKSILTPLKRHRKIIGAFGMSSTDLAEYFIPSVRNLAEHISTALELAEEHAERKKIEEALDHERSLLHLLMDNIPDWIFFKDAESRFTRINRALAHQSGLADPQEAVGKTDFDFYPREVAQRFYNEEQKIIQYGKPVIARVGPTPRRDGEMLWVSETKVPLYDETGKVVGLVGISRDISELKRTEEKVKEARDDYLSITNLTGDIIVKVDREGRWTFLNEGACQFWGKPREELIGSAFVDYLHPDDQEKTRAAVEVVRRKKLVKGLVNRQKTPKGWRIVEWNATAIFDRRGRCVGIQATGRDITERKKAEEKIEAYQKRLQLLASELTLVEERERRRIAAELHDSVSQLLTLGKIKLGQLEKVRTSPDSAALLEEIRDLLEQTIEYTRSLTFQLSPSVLHELGLEAALEWLAEYVYKQQGIQINLEVDSQTKPMNQDLRVFLFRAVRELLMNVVKHAKTDRAKVSLCREGESIHINVEDAGVGFDSAIIETPSDIDRGFGLFSILEHLRYLGGKLSIHSKPGQGTQVSLVAPLKGPQGKEPGRMR